MARAKKEEGGRTGGSERRTNERHKSLGKTENMGKKKMGKLEWVKIGKHTRMENKYSESRAPCKESTISRA
jgi:hypothetical protein